jgi:hypothetical protein
MSPATRPQSPAGVLEKDLLAQIRPELEAIRPMKAVFDQHYVKKLTGTHVKKGTKMELAEAVMQDMADFKKAKKCERLVMVWCGSTEIYLKRTAVHETLASFEKGLREDSPDIPPSMIYAYAAIKSGVPYANGAPNLGPDVPALEQLAKANGVGICGKDFKTGQTLIKTMLAPGFKARMLGVAGWYSTNILGNRDGEVLDDPENFKSKEDVEARRAGHRSCSRTCTPTCTATSTTWCASTTTRRAVTTRRAGTTSTSSAGWATRCRSRSTSCAATRSSPPRSCWTWRCSWTWPSAPDRCRASGVAELLLEGARRPRWDPTPSTTSSSSRPS